MEREFKLDIADHFVDLKAPCHYVRPDHSLEEIITIALYSN